MTTHKEALTLALEALEEIHVGNMTPMAEANWNKAITAIKEALAQPEQEPTNLERHKRNVQKFLGTQQPKEPEQETVAWWNGNSKFATPKAKDWDKRTGGTTAFGCDIPLYTTPPQRTWEGLSVFEINDLVENTEYEDYRDLIERTEAKLKEKNK